MKRKIRTAIRFLMANNLSVARINCELYTIYSRTIISVFDISEWICFLINGRTKFHSDERTGRAPVVSNQLIPKDNVR